MGNAQVADRELQREHVSAPRRSLREIGQVPSRALRVLVLNERCHAHPMAGGVEVGFFERYGRLTEQGADVELLCSGFPGAPDREVHRGVRISRVGSRLSYYARVPGEVHRRVRAGQVNVVVEELSKVPFLAPLYAGVPVVAVHHHLHGLTAFQQVSPLLACGSLALESAIPLVYRNVPFLSVSRSSKNDLIRRGIPEAHIELAFNGIDHELFRAAPVAGRAPLIVSVGRLEPYKRVDLALRAMPRVLERRPAARLAILGRGQEESRLRRLTAELGLTRHVTFAGYTSDAQKVAWLQAAALHVQCSSKEGWGLTVTEANACGTPVVATDAPGLCDSVQDGVTGLLVRHAAPEPLAAAIASLLADEEQRSRLARNALASSQNFRWEPFAAAMERVIRRAASRGQVKRVLTAPLGWKEVEVAA